MMIEDHFPTAHNLPRRKNVRPKDKNAMLQSMAMPSLADLEQLNDQFEKNPKKRQFFNKMEPPKELDDAIPLKMSPNSDTFFG